jgi:hypothetical protein
MKINSKTLFLSLFIILIFNSCKKNIVELTENNFSTRHFLSKDTTLGSIKIFIETEIPAKFKSKSVLDSIRTVIISSLYGNNYVKYPNDSLAQKFSEELINDYVLTNLPMVEKISNKNAYSFNFEHELYGFSLLSDKFLFSYGISRYVCMGGAHGLSTRNFFNFDLNTGKLLTEADIFTENYDESLKELIKTRIVEQSVEDSTMIPISNLEDTDYWVDTIKPNGNFYITESSINYVFNPYDIAPYSLGETEVILPFDRLKDILKKNTVISHLIEIQENP